MRAGLRPVRVVARPLFWLAIAVAGFAFAGIGVLIDAYRYGHGAAPAELVSRSNPGILISLNGAGIAALGVLVALSLLAFDDVESVDAAARRWMAVVFAWIGIACIATAAVTYAMTSGLTVGTSRSGASAVLLVPTSTAPARTKAFSLQGLVTLRGTLTLDDRPLQADFLGARVVHDGLVSACQQDIPRVDGGGYEIGVMADAAARGCGAPSARIVLWTFVGGQFLYSRETAPWPGDGASATFDASFSTSGPSGAAADVTAFKGHVARRDGTRLGGGSVVEAWVGGTRCGVATVRGDPDAWFTLLVAGPQLTGCARDGRITFRANGEMAIETATNDLGGDAAGHTIELTIG